MTDEELFAAYQLARVMAWQKEVDSLGDETVNYLTQRLLEAQRELKARMRRELEDSGEVSEWTQEMEREVSAYLSSSLAGYAAEVSGVIGTAALAVAASSVETYGSVLSAGGKASHVKLMQGLTEEQLRAFFADIPLNGRSLEEWAERTFSAGVQQAVLDAVREGVLAGEGVGDIVARVMQSIDIGFIRSRRDVEMLVRTYLQSANTGAMEAVFRQNEDVIRGYRRKESLDNRTCRTCALCDGLEYEKSEARPSLPAHPGCRGMYLPITKSFRDLGLDIDEMREVARPWVIREEGPVGKGGRRIEESGFTVGSYGKWFMRLSSENQRKTSIGPVRTALLKQGKVLWQELVDKRTGVPRTLQELGFSATGERE